MQTGDETWTLMWVPFERWLTPRTRDFYQLPMPTSDEPDDPAEAIVHARIYMREEEPDAH